MTAYAAVAERRLRALGVLRLLVTERWMILVPMLLFALGSGVLAFTRSRTYSVKASFMPESGTSSLATYAALASQLGMSLPTSDNEQSPEFYVYLLQSDALLSRITGSKFSITTDSGVVAETVGAFLGVKGPPGNVQTVRALKELRRALTVRYDARSGLITILVKTRSADLSLLLADSVLARLDLMNRDVRKTRAGEERRFAEARLAATQDDLQVAENNYQSFLEQNRNYNASPALTFTAARLQRKVTDREQLVATLRQTYEQASLEEVRNTPVISVIEPPVRPLIPDRRMTAVYALMGAVFGAIFGIGFVMSRRSLYSADESDREDLDGIWRELRAFATELRHPMSALKHSAKQRKARVRHADPIKPSAVQ